MLMPGVTTISIGSHFIMLTNIHFPLRTVHSELFCRDMSVCLKIINGSHFMTIIKCPTLGQGFSKDDFPGSSLQPEDIVIPILEMNK